MKEREISLIDLIADFLAHWRKILLLVLIGAVLGGVFGYISNVNTNKEQVANLEEAKDTLEEYNDTIAAGGTVEAKKLTEVQEIIDKGVTVYPGISVKHIILFAILLVFVYAFIFFMLYVMNDKVRVNDELDELFDIPQFGLVLRTKKYSKVFGKLDRLIYNMKFRGRQVTTEVKAMKLAYVSVKLAALKGGYEKVSLMGCDIKGLSQHVCEQLTGALEKENIQVEVLNDVLYEAQAMNKLKNTQCVVLVERIGSTTYKEIYKEVEMLKRLEIPVLGGILVE